MPDTTLYPRTHRRDIMPQPLEPHPDAATPAVAPQQPAGGGYSDQGLASSSPRDNPNGRGVYQPQIAKNAASEEAVLENLPPSSDPQVQATRQGMIASRKQTLARVGQLGPQPLQQPATGVGTPTPGTPQQPGSPAPAGSYSYNKTKHDLLKQQYTRQHQAWVDANKSDTITDQGTLDKLSQARDAAAKSLSDYENQFVNPQPAPAATPGVAAAPAPTVQPTAGAAPATQPTTQPTAPVATAAPGTPATPLSKKYLPDEGIPEANRSFESRNPDGSLHIDHSDPTYQQHIRDMYQSAGEGAARQNQEIAATPLPLPNDAARQQNLTAAQQAGAGGATQRNAIAKGKLMAGDTKGFAESVTDENQLQQDRKTAGTEVSAIKQRAKNAGPEAVAQRQQQTAANTTSANAATARLSRFDNGDYNLQAPLTQDELAGPVQNAATVDRFASSNAQPGNVYQRAAAGYSTRNQPPAPPTAAAPTTAPTAGLSDVNQRSLPSRRAGGQTQTASAQPPATPAAATQQPAQPAAPVQPAQSTVAAVPTPASPVPAPAAPAAQVTPEAHAAAAQYGGTVNADGTMSIGTKVYGIKAGTWTRIR